MLMPKKVKFRKQQRGRHGGQGRRGGTPRLRRLRPARRSERGWVTARADRGRPHRDHPLHQARRQDLDPHVPGQADHQEAAGDPHGQGQGRSRGLGGGGQARAASSTRWKACRRRTRARRCGWPRTSSSIKTRFVTRDETEVAMMKPAKVREMGDGRAQGQGARAAGAALQAALPEVDRPARQRRSSCARRGARSRGSRRARSATRQAEVVAMNEMTTQDETAAPAKRQRVGSGW